MRQKRKHYPGFQIGTALLLVVLTAVCLLIVSGLSLSAAIRDYAYSEKVVDKTKAYYEANSKAYVQIAKLLESDSTGAHSFEIPINETRALSVTVTITDDSYEILKWKEISSDTWENDDKIPVLGSSQEE